MQSKDMVSSCLDKDEQELQRLIDERACHEKELRIRKRNVKERRNDLKRLNEIELQKQEIMINVGTLLDDNLDVTKQQGKSSSLGNDTDVEGAKISKNGLDDDITIANLLMTKTKLSNLDETLKQNKLLKDRLLEVTLAEDVKNLVINSCMEIRNKNSQDEIERFSKESKDVSNESKTADTSCNDSFDVTQELSKKIIDLEKDLSKLEAQSIAFEIALQHKSQENNSLKTVQKENFGIITNQKCTFETDL
ncbi:hypothetical protein Tco_1153075 [Tanacetum coccineum]